MQITLTKKELVNDQLFVYVKFSDGDFELIKKYLFGSGVDVEKLEEIVASDLERIEGLRTLKSNIIEEDITEKIKEKIRINRAKIIVEPLDKTPSSTDAVI